MFNGIAFNEDYYVENIESEFNILVRAHTKDITNMVDIIILIMMKNKFIAYSDNLPSGLLSKSSYIDLKKK